MQRIPPATRTIHACAADACGHVRGRRGERLASMIERVARATSSIAGRFHTLQGHAVRVPYRMISNLIA